MSELDEMLGDAQAQTDREILDDAFTDSAPEAPAESAAVEPPAEASAPAEAPKPQEQADEAGQAADQNAEQSKPQAEGEKPEAEAAVPPWRLREVNEQRRQLEQDNAALKGQLSAMERRISALEPRQQPQPEAEEIDPIVDPQGFANRIASRFDQRLTELNLNNSLALAHVRHGDAFEKAYNSLIEQGQQGNRPLVDSLLREQNPGEAIVRWHKQNELVRETGGDISGYRDRLREDIRKELLADPEFRKAVIEGARSEASPVQDGQPNVQLPPSLSKATGGAQVRESAEIDGSERSIFDYAMK